MLEDEELVGGNSLVKMATFLAILIGTLVGGVLIATDASSWAGVAGTTLVGILAVIMAIFGWVQSKAIPPAPAADPQLTIGWYLFAELWRIIEIARANRTVFNAILGISWFWAFCAILLAQLPNYTKDVLGGDQNLAPGCW
jgi:hypothetical protein